MAQLKEMYIFKLNIIYIIKCNSWGKKMHFVKINFG